MGTVVSVPTHLDEFLPAFHFNEVHTTEIHGSAAQVFAAFKSVTAEEIPLALLLMGIRNLPARLLRKPIPRLARGTPVLEQFLRGGFLLLAEVPDRELVVGRIGQFWDLWGGKTPALITTGEQFRAFGLPGFAKAAVNFIVMGDRNGIKVSTETRVYACDPTARRKFGVYWRLIHPGSALIRRMMLRAVKRRVEASTAPRVI